MEFLEKWIRAILAASLLLAIVLVLTPKNAAGRMVSFAGTCIMLIVLISPIKRFDAEKLSAYGRRYSLEASELSERYENNNKKLYKDIIESESASYISKRAEELGIECSAEVSFDGEKLSGCRITAAPRNTEALSEIIEKELGISKELQVFKAYGN